MFIALSLALREVKLSPQFNALLQEAFKASDGFFVLPTEGGALSETSTMKGEVYWAGRVSGGVGGVGPNAQ